MARAVGDTSLFWGADTQLTITLASLAASSTWVAGRNSTAYVVSTLDNAIDVLLSGKIGAGTITTTGGFCEIWVVAPIDDAPEWPDSITASDANFTWTSADIKRSGAKLAAIIKMDTTDDRVYPFSPRSIAALFGGVLPPQFVVWVTQSTDAALSATAGNHEITVQPIYANTKLS
jgi:hypothetical protein